MKQLHAVLKSVLETGDKKSDRTGTGTISKFGEMMKFSLQHGMWPIVTSRKVAHKKIAEELEWMLKGIISVKWLQDRDNKIWDGWVGADGTIGPMYGEQWRNWNAGFDKGDIEKVITEIDRIRTSYIGLQDQSLSNNDIRKAINRVIKEKTKLYQDGGRGGVDQLQYVIDELKNNPSSRRICVNVWHAGLLPKNELTPSHNVDAGNMALAPCHSMWQVNTAQLSEVEILMQHVFSLGVIPTDTPTEVMNAAAVQWLLDNQFMGVKTIAATGVATEFQLTPRGSYYVREWEIAGRPTRKLSLLCYARSQDLPLGTVFNVGMYSLLAHILAQLTNMVAWEYTHCMGDHHIYLNQVDCVREQLSREPMKTPRVIVDPSIRCIEDFKAENLQVWYESHPAIKYPPAAI